MERFIHKLWGKPNKPRMKPYDCIYRIKRQVERVRCDLSAEEQCVNEIISLLNATTPLAFEHYLDLAHYTITVLSHHVAFEGIVIRILDVLLEGLEMELKYVAQAVPRRGIRGAAARERGQREAQAADDPCSGGKLLQTENAREFGGGDNGEMQHS